MPREADWIEYTGTIGKKKPLLITEDGVPKALTGYTVYLRAWLEGETDLQINRECNVTDEDNGEVEFEFQADDLPLSLAKRDLLVQLVLDEDAGDNILPTEVKVLRVKEGAPPAP